MIRNKLIGFISLAIITTIISENANCWPQSKPEPTLPPEEANEDTALQQPPPQDGGYDYDNSTNSNSTAEYEYYDVNNSTGGNNSTDDYYQYYYDYDNSTGADNSSTSQTQLLPTELPSDLVLQQLKASKPSSVIDNLYQNVSKLVQQSKRIVPHTRPPLPIPGQYLPVTKLPFIPSQQYITQPKPPVLLNQQIIAQSDRIAAPIRGLQQNSRVNTERNNQTQRNTKQQPIGSGEQLQKTQPIVPFNGLQSPQTYIPQAIPKILNIISPLRSTQSLITQTNTNIEELQTESIVTTTDVSEEKDTPPGNAIKKRDVRKAPPIVETKGKPIELVKSTSTEKPKNDDKGKKAKPLVSVSVKQSTTGDPLNVECLAAHNVYRKNHREPPFQLDPKLIQVAEQRAKALKITDKLAHDYEISYGENLHSRKNAKTISCDIVVKSWYNEIKDYNFDNPKLVPENLHFTQMMWKSTTHIGCAQGYSEKSRKIYTVCNYNPEGNVVGEELQQILKPS